MHLDLSPLRLSRSSPVFGLFQLRPFREPVELISRPQVYLCTYKISQYIKGTNKGVEECVKVATRNTFTVGESRRVLLGPCLSRPSLDAVHKLSVVAGVPRSFHPVAALTTRGLPSRGKKLSVNNSWTTYTRSVVALFPFHLLVCSGILLPES